MTAEKDDYIDLDDEVISPAELKLWDETKNKARRRALDATSRRQPLVEGYVEFDTESDVPPGETWSRSATPPWPFRGDRLYVHPESECFNIDCIAVANMIARPMLPSLFFVAGVALDPPRIELPTARPSDPITIEFTNVSDTPARFRARIFGNRPVAPGEPPPPQKIERYIMSLWPTAADEQPEHQHGMCRAEFSGVAADEFGKGILRRIVLGHGRDAGFSADESAAIEREAQKEPVAGAPDYTKPLARRYLVEKIVVIGKDGARRDLMPPTLRGKPTPTILDVDRALEVNRIFNPKNSDDDLWVLAGERIEITTQPARPGVPSGGIIALIFANETTP